MPNFTQILEVHFSFAKFMELCQVLPKLWGCANILQNYEGVFNYTKLMELWFNFAKVMELCQDLLELWSPL
jgi:hypothetical protein